MYNVVLVSGVQLSFSYIYIYVYIFFFFILFSIMVCYATL